jgi:hypothetical protein
VPDKLPIQVKDWKEGYAQENVYTTCQARIFSVGAVMIERDQGFMNKAF